VIAKAIQTFEQCLQCSNPNPEAEQTGPQLQNLSDLQGLQTLALSQLQRPESQSAVREGQGRLRACISRVLAMIAVMMVSRGITTLMMKGFTALTVVIAATTSYAALRAGGFRAANGSQEVIV
jgi:hypothetical protein